MVAAGLIATFALTSAGSGPGGTRSATSDTSGVAPSPEPFPQVTADAGDWLASFPDVQVTHRLAWGPTLEQWAAAQADARSMSLEDAAGQVIVAAWNSTDAEGAAALVSDLNLGGVILMGGAIDTATQVSALTDKIHAAGGDRDWGTIIGVDEEGGSVARLGGVIPTMPGFMSAGAASDKESVTDAYAGQGADLQSLGFTTDYAPVADVTAGLSDPTIRSRSAGSNPERVAATVDAAVAGYVSSGIVPVIKHFPGHGSVDVDSHQGLPVQKKTLAQLETTDIVPFRDAVDAGVPGVMMAHLVVSEWGGEAASVNPNAYEYLRDELGFTGLAMTDALNMAALQSNHSPGEAAVAALAAGADVLLLPPDPRAARDAIVAAVTSGDVPRARLDSAVARMIVAGRWQERLASEAEARNAEAPETYARDLTVAGATVAAESCTAPWIGDSVRVVGGTESDRAHLTAALSERGVTVAGSGTSIGLLGGDSSALNADIVVALAGPWGLQSSTATTYVGIYGRSSEAFAGLVDVLTGSAPPGGQWPVSLELPYDTCE